MFIKGTTEILDWLLEGDVAIQFQVHRDLLQTKRPDLQNRIAHEGWGAQFLSRQKAEGHWGTGFYHPKWTSTHYTLLDLKNLAIAQDIIPIQKSIRSMLDREKGPDGGMLPIGTTKKSDVCVNGMFLNYATYFKTKENRLESIVDFLLSQKMPDGGFNCISNRSGARHSSLHSTLSVLEGITEYGRNGYTYRLQELKEVMGSSMEFLRLHQLFLSDRTGDIIHKDFLKLSFPCRWRYDILRALDYFQYANHPWDESMRPAMEVILKKRNKNGTWKLQAKHPGQTHFEMEKAGKSSRWNTLRALRVLNRFGKSMWKT